MRVLVVSLGRRGGITDYGLAMAKGFAEHADVAAVYSPSAANAPGWAEVGFPTHALPTFSGLASMALSFLSLRRFWRVRRFARRFKPDVVYYPGGHIYKPLLDLVLPRYARTVLTVHDPELHEGSSSLGWRLHHEVNLRHVDGVILLNESQRERFIEENHLDQSRVAVVPHGIFRHLLDAARPLGQVGLDEIAPIERGYLLFIGRIERYKGLAVLLEAYARARDLARAGDGEGGTTGVPPLVIAGSGAFSEVEQQWLERLADGPVFVINRWLPDAEMASLTASARFVVLPYTSATQTGVIPLASAFGVPAIASATGGIAEQVIDGDTGILVPPGDPDELAATLLRATAMTDEAYARMSRRSREHAETEWAWSTLAERLVRFFDDLPADGRRNAS